MWDYIAVYLSHNLSLIPVRTGLKEPAVPWKQFTERRLSSQELSEMFQRTGAKNIGIVAGPVSGIVVLDVDGEEGDATLKELGQLPPTPTVKTGKGRHYYFRQPSFTVNNRVRLMPGLDIRGAGGYVVAPPSRHENGRQYEWEVDLAQAPFAEVPQWLVAMLQRQHSEIVPECLGDMVEEHLALSRNLPSSLSRAEKAAVDRILSELSQAEEGKRNDELNKASFALAQFVGNGSTDREWAEQNLAVIAKGLGLSISEIEATIRSGMSAGIVKPRERFGDVFKILDEFPDVIDRPLKLIKGRAYGVSWLPISGRSEGQDKTEVRPVVFRDDGVFFSELDILGSLPFDELGMTLDLPHEVPIAKRLSPNGFKRFVSGDRPKPSDVFERIINSIDAFVSFEHSLVDHRATCELVAAWTLGTYLTDAFDVLGYPWPSGERGSGKTQLLNTITRLAYLGKTVTAASTFPSIRDDAHYGATLGFDDCENVRDMDPSKRELLLAGNTRGTVISHKELFGDRWKTREVNSFAPRLFTAINLPDAVLDSRAIRLPMIASADKEKTRRSPTRPEDWPCDVRTLVDDLWMLGVGYLSRLQQCDADAAQMSPLVGRALDIFRMPLAVTYWLEIDHGARGVFDRMSLLAQTHQGLKAETGGQDTISLVLNAIDELLNTQGGEAIRLTAKQIAERSQVVAEREEMVDVAMLLDNAQRVGRMLGGLGFKHAGSHGSARSWVITRNQLHQVAEARGVKLMDRGNAETRVVGIELPR